MTALPKFQNHGAPFLVAAPEYLPDLSVQYPFPPVGYRAVNSIQEIAAGSERGGVAAVNLRAHRSLTRGASQRKTGFLLSGVGVGAWAWACMWATRRWGPSKTSDEYRRALTEKSVIGNSGRWPRSYGHSRRPLTSLSLRTQRNATPRACLPASLNLQRSSSQPSLSRSRSVRSA